MYFSQSMISYQYARSVIIRGLIYRKNQTRNYRKWIKISATASKVAKGVRRFACEMMMSKDEKENLLAFSGWWVQMQICRIQ